MFCPIDLLNCNPKVKCDTEFESGQKLNVDDIFNWCVINGKGCKDIVWTGGEPLDQLTSQIVDFFKQKGFFQCVETSGLYPCPQGIDFISVSPKVAEHVIKKNFPDGVTELRYIRHFGQNIPQPSINAKYYFVSPHSDGININSENLKHCINLCLTNPSWGMSVQSHKIWNIL